MANKNYSTGKFNFPSDDIDPIQKSEPKYNKDFAEAAWSLHIKGQGGVRNLKARDISLLKRYAEGRQPMEKYLDIVCPKDKTGKRKTFMDLSLDPISVIPKFRSIVIGKFLQQHHDIIASAIDEASGKERELMKLKVWAKAELGRALEPFKEMMSIGVEPSQAQGIIPSTIEELNMMEAVGSFKLLWEAAMEKLIKDGFQISDWEIIKQRLYENIFDTAMIATRDYTCVETGKAKARFVDIENLVVRYSNHKVYDNIDYAGEMQDLTPNTVKVAAGEQLPEGVIEQIIEYNKDITNYDYTYNNSVDDFYNKHGNVDIKVLDIAWLTIDTIKQERRTDERGEYHVNNVPYDYKKKSKKGKREILVGKKQMVYSCKWIVGTDYVYDYGIEEDVIRPTKKTAKIPFNIYKLSDKSMLELIIPHEDGLNLAWLNFQNALSKAAPPGIAIDVNAISNVTTGKNQLTPKQVLQIKRETGDLLFSATTHHNQVINPNAGRPVFDLPGGVGGYLREQMEIIDFNIGMIRQLTGINEMLDASAPPPNTLVGTAEIAAQGTNNTLYQMYFAYKTVKEKTADHLAYRIQSIIRYTDYKPYENVIGSGLLEMFKTNSPIAHSNYGIKLNLKPSQQDQMRMIERVNIAGEKGVIRQSDVLTLEEEVKNGSMKYARMILAYKEDQYEQLQAQREQERIQMQSQMIQEQQQSALQGRVVEGQEASKNKINEIYAKGDADVVEYREKGEMVKEQDNNKSNNKIKEDLLKG
jgi:hypothetical protein